MRIISLSLLLLACTGTGDDTGADADADTDTDSDTDADLTATDVEVRLPVTAEATWHAGVWRGVSADGGLDIYEQVASAPFSGTTVTVTVPAPLSADWTDLTDDLRGAVMWVGIYADADDDAAHTTGELFVGSSPTLLLYMGEDGFGPLDQWMTGTIDRVGGLELGTIAAGVDASMMVFNPSLTIGGTVDTTTFTPTRLTTVAYAELTAGTELAGRPVDEALPGDGTWSMTLDTPPDPARVTDGDILVTATEFPVGYADDGSTEDTWDPDDTSAAWVCQSDTPVAALHVAQPDTPDQALAVWFTELQVGWNGVKLGSAEDITPVTGPTTLTLSDTTCF
jgi:hypothetical protein